MKINNTPGKKEVRAFLFEIINGMSEAEMRRLLKELEDRQKTERRMYRRKNFFMTVDYQVADRYYRDFIQNISTSGVFIKTSQTFSVGDAVLMTFMSPDYQKPFRISGEVARLDSEGVGVKFNIESSVQEDALTNLVGMLENR
jgi:Tfp pilus assembly protein PilZ